MNRKRDGKPKSPKSISRAEKARLLRIRVENVERRERQRAQHASDEVLQLEERERHTQRMQPDRKPPIRKVIDDELDFYDDEAEYDVIHVDEVIGLLRSIERHRQGLRDHMMTLHRWLNGSSEFAEAWRTFTQAGGISAEDFDKFIDGGFCARRARCKRHLRLISSIMAPSHSRKAHADEVA
jgi:hypothetical protein